jgi:peptidoglycan/LPS O-acetylase OafA/YrhL
MRIEIKENKTSIKSLYRPEINGLRAFAVVAVIINHFNKEILPNGYLGVDMFFVISGFVLTSSLYQRPSNNFKNFIRGFYERRVKRLVPVLSVFILIMSIAICLFNPHPQLSLRTGLTSLIGLSNIYLIKQSTDYFGPSTELNVFTHTWSLGVEEQFYILFPFLIWFSGFGRQTKNGARNLFLIVVTLTISSLIGFLYLYPINQSAAYFLMPTRFWEIAAGCLTFLEFQRKNSIKEFLEKIPPILVMAIIIGVMYLPMSLATSSTVAVVALSAVLFASLKEGTVAYKFFTNTKIVYVGLISYSLYLWHWGILSISRWTIGIHWWSVPFQISLMFVLAFASYQWIEKPLRKKSWSFDLKPFRFSTLFIGIATIITNSIAIVGISKYSNLIFIPRLFEIEGRKNYADYLDCHGENHLKKLVNPIDYCLKTRRSIKHPRRFFLLGDSHAAQLIFMANKTFENSFFEISYIYTGEFIHKYVKGKISKLAEIDELEEINNYALEKDILAISFHRGHLNKLLDFHVYKSSDIDEALIESAYQRLKAPLQELVKRGVRIILIRDVPLLLTWNNDITTCLMQTKFFKQNVCDVSHSQDSLTRSAQDLLYDKLVESLKIETWDPRKYMLSNNNMYKVNDGEGNEMMLNQSHITKSFSERLSNYFMSDVMK